MRCGAMQSRRAKMEMTCALGAMHDMCTPLITGLWATHTRSVAYQPPGANRNTVGVWMFSLDHSPCLTSQPISGFSLQIKYPPKGSFSLFAKQNFLNVMQCYVGHLGSKCSCMQWQYDQPPYSWYNSIASIIQQYMHFYIEFPKISD